MKKKEEDPASQGLHAITYFLLILLFKKKFEIFSKINKVKKKKNLIAKNCSWVEEIFQ